MFSGEVELARFKDMVFGMSDHGMIWYKGRWRGEGKGW
jgi:hypothetical protein